MKALRHFIILAVAIIFHCTVFGQTASFTSDVISGCAPLVVHFTNTSSGATSYHWDLGNGTTSGLTDVSGSFLTPGTYTITLIAYSGSSSNTHTTTITVYPSPTVSFYATDTSVCPGTAVNFVSTTVGGVAGPMTYIWSFGDGTSSTSGSPSHVFPGPGYYNITLFVTNSVGCQSSLTKGAYIHVYNPPAATISAPTTHFCAPPATASFTAAVTGIAPFTYSWTFGDGGSSSSVAPTHTYTATGVYTVRLIVTDGHGCKDTVTNTNYIVVSTLTANFSSVSTACVNSWVLFHNTSSTHSSSSWTFGDGGTSTLDSPYHMFTTAGTYTVTLVISNGPCHDTVTHTIIITPGPSVSFTSSPVLPCPAPSAITFTGAGIPAGGSVVWRFGDGTSGTGSPATHTYSSSGIDTVLMITTDASGCRDTIVHVDTIHDLYLVVHDTPFEGCVPLTVYFSYNLLTTNFNVLPHVLIAYPYGVATYSWDFGDGTSSTTCGATPTHIYTATGVYHGHISIMTVNGCTVMDSFIIKVGTPPVASFYAIPTHICADHSVSFISTSTGTINEWQWFFGDGGGADDTIPTASHMYAIPDTFYSVTLIVYDNGCPSAPFTIPHYITVDSPKALFSYGYACTPPTSVSFVDSSIGATSYIWLFGDGTTSTLLDPVHNFPGLTTYSVALATYNFRSGCRDTAVQWVDLVRPVPTFIADDTAICKGGRVRFTALITGGTPVFYHWMVKNSVGVIQKNIDVVGDTFLIDTFLNSGIYTVSLIIADWHGCQDTFTRTNYIIVAKPIDSFFAMPPLGCWPLDVAFVDSSHDVPGTWLTNFSWTYGDGASASVTTNPTSHVYSSAGSFNVQEIVTDNIGCKDTLLRPLYITVFRPHAVFTTTKTYPCIDDSVIFTNLSVGITSSFWLFGDGDSSYQTSPTHAYMATGAYTVKLVVTDAHGCTDTATYVNYIHVTRPVASFHMSDSFTICIPLNVQFFNTSSGAVSYHWSFGNGDSSIGISPTELYVTNGYDSVILIAKNPYGCKDTAYGVVNLYGYAGGFSYNPDTGCSPLVVHFNAGLVNVPSIVWDFADGITSLSSSLDTITHVYSIPGKYLPKLILSDNTGCKNSSKGLDTIKVDAVYAGFTTVPHPVCVGEQVNFKDTSHSYFSTITQWLWIINGTDTATSSSPPYTFESTGTFSVTLVATDGWGCAAGTTGYVNVLPPPVIKVSPDTTVCLGDAATLTGSGGVSYIWSPGGTLSCTACNPTAASPTVVTQYTVAGTDANGCHGTDTVSVFLKTKTITVAHGGGSVCLGENVQLSDSGATKYLWIPAPGLNNANSPDPVACPSVNTTYEVIGQLGSCIPDTAYVTVVVHPLPTVNAGPDQTIIDGASANLKATGHNVYTIAWSPAQTLNCDSCINPVATPPATTTYTVSVANTFGCRASDSVTIHVICDASQVFIPNAFTPNGDGNNDVFFPRGSGITTVKAFRIYNRWGELLFERTNFAINEESNAWNGTYEGGAPRPDVYVYLFEAVCENGELIFIKGDVTIIK